MEPRIVCAALRKGDKIICGPRHFDQIMIGQIKQQIEKWVDAEQGFVDQFCNFYNRADAYDLAVERGQIERSDRVLERGRQVLISENLY